MDELGNFLPNALHSYETTSQVICNHLLFLRIQDVEVQEFTKNDII